MCPSGLGFSEVKISGRRSGVQKVNNNFGMSSTAGLVVWVGGFWYL